MGADAGAQDPGLGLLGPHPNQSFGVGSPHDQGDPVRLARPAADLPSHLQVQGPAVCQCQTLEVTGFGVRGAAEQKQPLAGVAQKGGEGLSAQVGIQGHGLDAPLLEDRPGVRYGCLADVVALGVENDRDLRRHHGQGFPQRRESLEAVGLVEGDVGLEAGREGGRGFDHEAVAFDHLPRRLESLFAVGPGIQPHAQQAVGVLAGALQSFEEVFDHGSPPRLVFRFGVAESRPHHGVGLAVDSAAAGTKKGEPMALLITALPSPSSGEGKKKLRRNRSRSRVRCFRWRNFGIVVTFLA